MRLARKRTRVLTGYELNLSGRMRRSQNRTIRARIPSRTKAMSPARIAAIMYERLHVDDDAYHCDGCGVDRGPTDCDAIKPS